MKTLRLLFDDEMARAIVQGRKCVTRRPAFPFPVGDGIDMARIEGRRGLFGNSDDGDVFDIPAPCAPGDLMIGRECFQFAHPEYHSEDEGLRLGKPVDPNGRWCWYRADSDGMESGDHEDGRPRWRPSIHMPDWAARIRRTVVTVSVERLQAITEEDAVREGSDAPPADRIVIRGGIELGRTARSTFSVAWDAIYFARGLGWAVNPWCFRIEFGAENVSP